MFADKADWNFWLKLATFSCNTSWHEGIDCTPHELIFGFKARLPIDFLDEIRARTYSDYSDELILRLNNSQKHARERIIKAKEISKKLFD